MTYEFGLRERKKAQLKLDLLDAMLVKMERYDFDGIKVSEICDMVSISEVTFFKYFDRKDELLLYYMQVWAYKRELRLHKEGRKTGIAAIYSIFDDIAKTPDAKKKMNTFSGFFSRLKKKPDEVNLSLCEKWLINKDVVLEKSSGLDEQLIEAIDQGKKTGEINKDIDTEAMHILLATIFYGTPLIAHMTDADLQSYYADSLDMILK